VIIPFITVCTTTMIALQRNGFKGRRTLSMALALPISTGTFYAVWTGSGEYEDEGVMMSVFDGSTRTEPRPVPGSTEESYKPSCAVYRDDLYVAWRSGNGPLWWNRAPLRGAGTERQVFPAWRFLSRERRFLQNLVRPRHRPPRHRIQISVTSRRRLLLPTRLPVGVSRYHQLRHIRL
jgi:hypothetical protein